MSDLFDLSPTAWLLLLMALLACLPLAWLLRAQRQQSSPQKLAALALLLLVLTFDLTIFGAFTRLTESGLGCPDWPGCYGTTTPLHANDHINAALAADPYGPVSHKKAWIEMVHRYLAGAVGFLIIVQMVWSWLRRRSLPYSPWLPVLTFVWVCAQGAFGALTVTMKLFPLIVSLHLLGALGLLALLQIQSTRWRLQLGVTTALPLRPALHALLWGSSLLLLLQIALGAWVSTNYAVVACNTWPLCGGELLPPADYAQGFSLWRELHQNADGSYLSLSALLAIHLVHRWVAVPVILLLGYLAWQLRATAPKAARWLVFLLVAQFATGFSNVVLGWPLLAALLHTAGAAAFFVLLVNLLVRSHNQAAK